MQSVRVHALAEGGHLGYKPVQQVRQQAQHLQQQEKQQAGCPAERVRAERGGGANNAPDSPEELESVSAIHLWTHAVSHVLSYSRLAPTSMRLYAWPAAVNF